ncbi:hypothetical protein ACS0TY_008522 [Phlomoides rotata]
MSVGLGMVAHNEMGGLIQDRSMLISVSYEPDEAEALGILEALSWVKQLGFVNVVSETDAQGIFTALRKGG